MPSYYSFAPLGLFSSLNSLPTACAPSTGSRQAVGCILAHGFAAASSELPGTSQEIMALGRILAGLCGYKTLIILTSVWNHLHAVLQSTIQSIGESGGEIHGEKVDIKLQVPLRIQTVNY